MKEQDVAHFGSGVPSTLEFQEQHIEVLKAELTRLRSELQREREKVKRLSEAYREGRTFGSDLLDSIFLD